MGIVKPVSFISRVNPVHPRGRNSELFWAVNSPGSLALFDASLHGREGAISGATWGDDGDLDFNGTNALVTVARIPGLTDWSAWIRFTPDDVTSISRTLLDQGDIYIGQIDDDIIYGATDSLEITYSSTVSSCLTAGAEVDILVTRSGTTITAYVYDSNGALSTDNFTASGTANSARTNLVIGAPSRTAYTYPASAMTNLTAEQIAIINAADVLEIPTGSASLGSVIVREGWNGIQYSFEAIIRPDFVPGDGQTHYVFDNQGTGASQDRSRCYIDTAGLLAFVAHDTDSTQHLVSHDVTDWAIGTEYYIVCVLDFNNDSMILYVSGTAEDNTPTAALSSDSMGAVGTKTYIGQDSSNANQLNGGIKYRIWNRVLSATEITAQWNSGDMTEFDIVSADVIAIDRFTESNTGIISHPFGKTVSAIANGATESTLTTAAGSDTAFAENDAVRIQGADGFGVQGFIDDTIASESVTVDDGAGALVTDIEKVGVNLDFDGSEKVSIPDCFAVDPTAVSVAMWFKADDTSGDYRPLAYNEDGMYMRVRLNGGAPGQISGFVNDGGNAEIVTTAYDSTKWTHVILTSLENGNTKLYVNGTYIDSEATGPFLEIGTTGRFIGASRSGLATRLNGNIAEVQLFNIELTAADALTMSTNPNKTEAWIIANTTVGAGNMKLYHNYRNKNLLDLTANNNDGTHSGTPTYDTSAFVSRKLLPTIQNGGIGGLDIVGTPVTVAKEAGTGVDEFSLNIVSDDANEGISVAVDATNGDKFWFMIREFVTNGSFTINVTNGGGDLETGINDASSTVKEYIISATGNLAIRLLSEQAADDLNIVKWDCIKCIAGDSLTAGLRYTLVYNVDTTTTGIAWSGLGSDATEVKAGDLYIHDDTAPATTAMRTRNYMDGKLGSVAIWNTALEAKAIEAHRRQPYVALAEYYE